MNRGGHLYNKTWNPLVTNFSISPSLAHRLKGFPWCKSLPTVCQWGSSVKTNISIKACFKRWVFASSFIEEFLHDCRFNDPAYKNINRQHTFANKTLNMEILLLHSQHLSFAWISTIVAEDRSASWPLQLAMHSLRLRSYKKEKFLLMKK